MRNHFAKGAALSALPCIPVPACRFASLSGPARFRVTLLEQIALARRRIFIAALYLQDDDGGREVLDALYAAKAAHPALQIEVFVDWHRAQRGLIGQAHSPGNAARYQAMARKHPQATVNIHGVPVQRRELLGVMHLKGFVFDDTVLYSGASLNDVYLQTDRRYRIDRYHLIECAALADSLVSLMTGLFLCSPAIHLLNAAVIPQTAALRSEIARLRRTLSAASYDFSSVPPAAGEVGITPLIGLGKRGNALNAVLLQLIGQARARLVLFTPYFNLPGPLRRALARKIKAGCQVTLVIGDKTANDFYIPPEAPFRTIGALPYLYEANLRRFCKTHQKAIDAGHLNVLLWRDGDNTFHLKGLLVDDDYALLTGNNLNPRAWRLDLENALLIHDPQRLLSARHEAELAGFMAHTQRLEHHAALEDPALYPLPVQRLLRRLARVRADRLINQLL